MVSAQFHGGHGVPPLPTLFFFLRGGGGFPSWLKAINRSIHHWLDESIHRKPGPAPHIGKLPGGRQNGRRTSRALFLFCFSQSFDGRRQECEIGRLRLTTFPCSSRHLQAFVFVCLSFSRPRHFGLSGQMLCFVVERAIECRTSPEARTTTTSTTRRTRSMMSEIPTTTISNAAFVSTRKVANKSALS